MQVRQDSLMAPLLLSTSLTKSRNSRLTGAVNFRCSGSHLDIDGLSSFGLHFLNLSLRYEMWMNQRCRLSFPVPAVLGLPLWPAR